MKAKLKEVLESGSYFVLWRMPGENEMHLIADANPKPISILECLHEKGFIYFPFNARRGYLFRSQITGKTQAVKDDILPYVMEKEEYLKRCAGFIEEIKKGKFEKLVFSRIKEIIPKTEKHPAELFFKLCDNFPNAFVHLAFLPEYGWWMGATPETLTRCAGGKMSTMALAGTQAHDDREAVEIAWAEKEKHEQALVSDFIGKRLWNLGIRQFRKSDPETVLAGRVAHIRTRFDFEVDSTERAEALIDQLHPTPAVCGLPQHEARQFILDHEPHDRSLYSGFFGPVNDRSNFDLFVNLRCGQIIGNRYYLYLGGGITSASDPEKEWDETELKAKTMESVLL
jgi:isochorismate synthase